MSTVTAVLRETFPVRDGEAAPYLAFPERRRDADDVYATPPMLPFDLFAIAARLLQLSGAYHHIAPTSRKRLSRLLAITGNEIAEARAAAAAWRAMDGFKFMSPDHAEAYHRWRGREPGEFLSPLFRWWTEVFVEHKTALLVDGGRPDRSPPPWWRPALLLFIAADEAAAGVGFHPAVAVQGEKTEAPWFERFVYLIFLFVGRSMRFEQDGTAATSAISTFSCAEKIGIARDAPREAAGGAVAALPRG